MRTIIVILGGVILAVVCGFCYITWLSPKAREGKRNQQNSYRVQPGMSQREALKIMGPAKQVLFVGKQKISYRYSAHPFASDDVWITIKDDSLVTTVNHGE